MTLTALNLSSQRDHADISRQPAWSPNGRFINAISLWSEEQPEHRLRGIHKGLSEGLRILQSFTSAPLDDGELFLSFYRLYGHYIETAKSTGDLPTNAEQVSVGFKPFLKRVLNEALSGREDRIHIWMGEIHLSPSVALIVGVTILEFIKNSAAAGALASQGGFAGITAKVNTASGNLPRLALEWQEYGGRLIGSVPADSMAKRLLDHGIADGLKGEVEIACDAPGLRCRFDLPL